MKVLIGCATSCVALDAFLRLGHDAWQCDLLLCDDDGECFATASVSPEVARSVARDLTAMADRADACTARQKGMLQ